MRRNPLTIYFINNDLRLCTIELTDIRRASNKKVLILALKIRLSERPHQDQG
jgi:hypothetical protein